MRPIDKVLEKLHSVKRTNGNCVALCPSHDDHKRSLSISEGDDGRVLIKCHAGCKTADVVKAMGLKMSDLFPKEERKKNKNKTVATYSYQDRDGEELFQVVRLVDEDGDKEFRCRRRNGANWVWNLKGVQRVLYHLPEVLNSDGNVVYIAEGEKSVDAVRELGLIATCNPHGAGDWRDIYNESLRGCSVVILPDNDPAGLDHAEDVARSLQNVASSVKVLELPDLAGKEDVVDWITQGGDKDTLELLANLAPDAATWLASRKVQNPPTTMLHDGPDMPELPECARLPEELSIGASPWLDSYIEFSKRWSPRSYDGFHQAVGLWVLSTIAARRLVLHLGPPRYTPLYIALCARTSLFAKSTCADIGVALLRMAELDWLLASDDATPQHFVRSLTVYVPSDFDDLSDEVQGRIELQLGLAASKGWFYEEFGQKLSAMTREGSFMADFAGILRRLDDCKERYEYATIGRGLDTVERPYLALLACLTPADLKPVSKRGASAWLDGFFARFAFVTPHGNERKRERFPEGERCFPADMVMQLIRWHEKLGIPEAVIEDAVDEKGEPTGKKEVTVKPLDPIECTLGDGVVDAYYNYHDALLDILENSENTDLDGNYTRFAEKALRIAMLLASLENDNHIELKHWARAQQITEDWRADLHSLYRQVIEADISEAEEMEAKVLRVLKKQGALTAAMVANYIRGLSTSQSQSILDGLIDGGMVTSEKKKKARYYKLRL